jgi:hypothetical protein
MVDTPDKGTHAHQPPDTFYSYSLRTAIILSNSDAWQAKSARLLRETSALEDFLPNSLAFNGRMITVDLEADPGQPHD